MNMHHQKTYIYIYIKPFAEKLTYFTLLSTVLEREITSIKIKKTKESTV